MAAVLVLALGLAPLTHELTAAAIRPVSRSGVAGSSSVPKREATTPEPPPLLPILAATAVVVAGILLAGLIHRESQSWDDTNDHLALDLRRLLEQDNNDEQAWRLDMLLDDNDASGVHERAVVHALTRHDDDGFPTIAPVRYVFGGLLPLAFLLALSFSACGIALRGNMAALPATQWHAHARVASSQAWDVLAGPISPLTLIATLLAVASGGLGLLVGIILGQSSPRTRQLEQPAGAQARPRSTPASIFSHTPTAILTTRTTWTSLTPSSTSPGRSFSSSS